MDGPTVVLRPARRARKPEEHEILWGFVVSCLRVLRATAIGACVVPTSFGARDVPTQSGGIGSARTSILAAEDARAPTPADLALLVESAASPNPLVQRTAIRALGRLERRDVVSNLIPYLRSAQVSVRTEAAFAIAQAMKGEPLGSNSPLGPDDGGLGGQVDAVLGALLAAAAAETEAVPLGESARSVARLPFERPEQVARAEALLRQVLMLSKELALVRKKPGGGAAAVAGGVAGAEIIARLHFKLSPPSEALIELLRGHVKGDIASFARSEAPPPSRALQALIAARGMDEPTLTFGLQSSDEHVRRLAVLALNAAGSPISGAERATSLRKAMGDKSFFVRYEAVRGYARTHATTDGCAPLLDTLTDPNPHVALAAIDAIGDACRGDENAVFRIVAETRAPPARGLWQREAHALVALAKLSPQRAENPLLAHSRHLIWQVRMYAARAAAVMNDVSALERLADDVHDNVREATLAALKRIKGDAAETQFAAALARDDYQLLLTAATESKGMTPTPALTAALIDALKRTTAQKKETSRDTRLALVQRLREIGTPSVYDGLVALLRDFDPRVAVAAAEAMTALTGNAYMAEPQPLPLQALPSASELGILENYTAVLVMEGGKDIELELDPDVAPVTAVRFLRLSNANYFDGLTFHRVVPNFVVQGGSPGANEYAGDGPYLRDEISTRSHHAGTVGLSTRGRDTGDAQIFFNLVHNPRLDYEYTILGHVSATSLARMWEIVEGDVIRDVKWLERRTR